MTERVSGGEALFIEVTADDLGPLFVDRLGVTAGTASPLQEILKSYIPGSATLSDSGQALAAERAEMGTLARIVAEPALVIVIQEGGGPRPVVRRVACHAPVHDGEAFVTVTAAEDGAVDFRWDPTPWQFLAEWLSRIATRVETGSPNLIPPPTNPEELVLLLHAVDLFRRVQLENLLDPEGCPQPRGIDAERLIPTLVEAIERRDPRWLVSAWATMMPDGGLDAVNFDDPDVLDVLVRRRFLVPEDPDAEGGLLLFGPPAVEMGTEFMIAWSSCCGFQAMTARDTALEPETGAFLATTGLAHHLFLRRDGDDGSPLVVHQTLTRSELDTFMARTLAGLLEAAVAAGAGGADEEETQALPRVAVPPLPEMPGTTEPGDAVPAESSPAPVCPACGRTAPPDARFCGYCGSPLQG